MLRSHADVAGSPSRAGNSRLADPVEGAMLVTLAPHDWVVVNFDGDGRIDR